MKPEILQARIVHEGWTKFLILDLRLPNGEKARREILVHGRAAAVLPFDPLRRVAMLVRQFRPPVFYADRVSNVLEAIAGMMEESGGADCARREAFEETGLSIHSLKRIGTFWSSPGISTETIEMFLAEYGANDRTGEGGGADGEQEDIAAAEVALAELGRMADAGNIRDLKTFALIQTLRALRPALF